MIVLRIDKVNSMANREADTPLTRLMVPQAPDVGEGVSVLGEPYTVIERGWAYGDDGVTYCFIRVR